MGDIGPEKNPEEQYPLLKVGAGDAQPTPNILPPGWGIHYPKKNTWIARWPECMSACWMTVILFGISFLVFYALGMGAYRRQQFIFIKCNTSRPASNVFYHHLVHRGMPVPFLRHSEYLANMATQYPSLHFHVFFLIDDTYTTNARRSRFLNRLVPYIPYISYSYKMDDNTQQALIDFQKKFQNVNITIIPLNKYMSGTSLRFKWRTIPRAFLPFYARVYSVWENGGVGIDLTYHSASGNNLAYHKMASILQQHNDGINPESYTKTLDNEDTAVFAMLFGLVDRFLNETYSFFNRTLLSSPLLERKPETLVRTHRAKRDVAKDDSVTEPAPILDVSNTSAADIVEQSNTSNPMLDLAKSSLGLLKNVFGFSPNATNQTLNKTDATQVVLFYDFQIVSDNFEPTYMISEPLLSSDLGPSVVKSRDGKDSKRSEVSHLLSIDPEGTFLSASSRLHPFLGQLVTANCQRMSPKFLIQDALIRQCSGLPRNDVYCNNIYIL